METFLSENYEEIIKKREEYWNSFFEKYKKIGSVTEEGITIKDISNKSNIKGNKRLKNWKTRSRLGQIDNCSYSISKSYYAYMKAYKRKKSKEIFEVQNIKTDTENDLSIGINNHVKSIYQFLLKNCNENIEFVTFLWVKAIMEEDSSRAINELLKDKEFTRSKIKTLVKVLSHDDVLQYFRFYLQYIRLHQYVVDFGKDHTYVTGQDSSVNDMLNTSFFKEKMTNSKSKSPSRQIDNYPDKISNYDYSNKKAYKRNKPEEIFEVQNIKTDTEHDLSIGINNHVKSIYQFLLKNCNENIEFVTFLWVKAIMEEDSSRAINELLKDKEFTRSKIKTLVKVLSHDDVLKYFRFYLQYIRLH